MVETTVGNYPVNTVTELRYVYKVGATPTLSDARIGYASELGEGSGFYASMATGRAMRFEANTRIALYVHQSSGAAQNISANFSVVKTGAGPQGQQGPAGSPLYITESVTPPANPQIGDLWLYHPVAGVSWIFRYEPDQDATYPWQFIGGPPYSQQETGPVFSCPAYNTWYNAGKIAWTPVRSGRYIHTYSSL